MEVSFHGVPYVLTVSTIEGETLCIEVEQKSDASRWRGDFTSRCMSGIWHHACKHPSSPTPFPSSALPLPALPCSLWCCHVLWCLTCCRSIWRPADIEDITAKTGNYKKFSVFVKMLLSAVKQASDSVFVDLLTYQDLEVLKSRKSGGQAPQQAKPLVPNNKRYLILTYAAEFDRVHYPLPLLYEENPDPQHLKSIISKLRSELDAVQLEQTASKRGGELAGELRRLREENTTLRQQLKQLDRAVKSDLADPDRASAEARELARELKMVGCVCMSTPCVRVMGECKSEGKGA